MTYQVIKSDVFNISNRIKSIDKKYFLIFNPRRKKFEVHYDRKGNTYELTLPYDVLDARAVEFVRKTQMQNKQKIFDEIERTNMELEKKNTKRIIENANRRIYENQ